MRLYFFNWPSAVGGADTKVAHLLRLLSPHFEITVVPNTTAQLNQPEWADFVTRCGCRTSLLENLPDRLDGWAVSLCNAEFFKHGTIGEVRRRGLRVAWSSEMMWHFAGECAALAMGWIDAVLYVSPEQRARLEPAYRHALGISPAPSHGHQENPAATSGWLAGSGSRPPVRWGIIGNYIDPDAFPLRPLSTLTPPAPDNAASSARPFVIGRLSRPDPDKFPDDFPSTYESLGLRPPVRFRVMGWSDDLARRWSSHHFNHRWDLLPTASQPTVEFLHSLDLFVYDTSPRFSESWGRAVVEAMLCGVVPLVPADPRHHLHQLVPHGHAGFHCGSATDFARHAQSLQADQATLATMARHARTWAITRLCQTENHIAQWRQIFQPSDSAPILPAFPSIQ